MESQSAAYRDAPVGRDSRVLVMLQRLLAIRSPQLRPALDEAVSIIAETFEAATVDVFVYQADLDSLVPLGASHTRMSHQQPALGLDRLPLADGGRAAWVYRTGQAYATGRLDEDPLALRANVESLGVRSMVSYPLEVDGVRRGVLQVGSTIPDYFADADRDAFGAVAGWISLIMHRAKLAEQRAIEAEQRGGRLAGEELTRLTRRQVEIATLIAEGLPNAAIAERLTLARGTVANHIRSIMSQLGLQNRVRVAVWAVEHGLAMPAWQDPPEQSN